MTEPRIYTAEEAVALLEKVTPGRWHVAEIDLGSHIDVCISGEGELDLITGELLCASDEEAALIAAAPDLAASVAHHARRADAAEAENKRLRDLVQAAYREGWSAGEHGAGFGNIDLDWLHSTACAEVSRG